MRERLGGACLAHLTEKPGLLLSRLDGFIDFVRFGLIVDDLFYGSGFLSVMEDFSPSLLES